MATEYTLKAGHTLSVTVNEGRAHVHSTGLGVGSLTRSSAAYGPYLVDTIWQVDGNVSVTTAEYQAAYNAYIYPNAGAPADAAQATLSANPTGDDNGIVYTARVYGTEGNSITVEYVDPGADAALSVDVFRQAITVNLAYASAAITSTAAEVLAAIQADAEANALVSAALDTTDTNFVDGSGVVTALAAAALTGGAGTGINIVSKGALVVDTTNGALYQNTGTQAVPAYSTSLTVANGVPATVDIALAASATTDGMDITLTVQDAAGATIAGVFLLHVWISEAATGAGLTADTYSGDVTVVSGEEVQEITSKKEFIIRTAATGIATMLAVDSANPTDQYIAVANPLTGQAVVSAASGTNWEGAV